MKELVFMMSRYSEERTETLVCLSHDNQEVPLWSRGRTATRLLFWQ